MGRLCERVCRVWPAMLIAAVTITLLTATPAAADWTWDIKNAIWGQSNPALSFIQLTDSHGVSVWQYELSIDRGHPITGPDKWFWAKVVDPLWQLYRDVVLVAIWLVRWVLDFGWVAPIADASLEINHALGQVVDQLGLVSLFLFIAGVVGACYIARGRIATGVWEICLAVLIVAGLGTFLANPAGMILSPETGVVYKARDGSLDLVASMSDDPSRGGQAQVDAISASMVETFIRQPLELVNFGVIVDGGPCEASYDEVLKSGPHAWGAEIRDKVNSCNDKLGGYAGNPSPSMVTSLLLMYLGSFVVLATAVFIAGSVMKAGVQICYQAVKATVTAVIGVLPGAARRPLWGTIADLVIAVAVFVFSFVWLAVFLNLVRKVLGGSPDMPATQKIVLMDVLLVIGLILFLTNKKRIEAASWKLRELLASRPGGGAGVGSPAQKLNTAMAVSAAANVAHLAKSLSNRKAPARPPQQQQGGTALGAAAGGFVGGGFNPPRPIPAAATSGGGGTARQMVATGAKVVLGHVTGGASTAIMSAHQVLRLARPKPRPQLTAGNSAGGGSNPAVRPTGGVRQLPGRRILELPPGPSATKPSAGTPAGSGKPSAGRGRAAGTASTRRPTPAQPGALGGKGQSPTVPPPARKPARSGGVPAGPAQTGNQVPRQRPAVQQHRPVRRPQGPRGR